jgi:signal transduction histidine kinase
MEIGNLFLDATGLVTWADPRATALLALIAKERSIEQPLADLLQLSAENRRRLAESLQTSEASARLEQLTSDDMVIVVQLRAMAGRTSGNEAAIQYHCQLLIRDDTAVERTALAAVQLRTTIQTIIAGFAHEVRNPLAAILSITEAAIQADAEVPERYRGLLRIPELVGRIESLIRQAYDYSKPACPRRRSVACREMIDNAIEMLRPKYPQVLIEEEVEQALPPVHVDSGQIERTLINLLENACYAARQRVTVVARLTRMPSIGAVLIEVADDGNGMPEQIQQRIFQPFFTTKAKGTGLGLALARDLARINGGDLRLRCSSSEGTTFRLILPTEVQAAVPPAACK